MITENELFTAVVACCGEVERGEISASIAIRDIRRAFKIFEAQPTKPGEERPMPSPWGEPDE